MILSLPGHSFRYDLSAPPPASQVFATGARQRKTKHALISETSAGKTRPELFHLTHKYDMEVSPFFCPIFSGALKSEGCCFQSERLLYGREPNGVRAEPGKQKPRSCRTQELA